MTEKFYNFHTVISQLRFGGFGIQNWISLDIDILFVLEILRVVTPLSTLCYVIDMKLHVLSPKYLGPWINMETFG